MILLSVTGLFRTLLIIFGVIFLLRIVGKMAQARRNIAEEQRLKNDEAKAKKMKEEAEKNYGRTSISKVDKNKISDSDYADFEEIED